MPGFTHFPNLDGRPDEDAVRTFNRLSSALLDFASRHSLLVRKFPHDYSMWTFHFLHPKGGSAVLQVSAQPLIGASVGVQLHAHWWIDNEQTLVRTAALAKKTSFEIGAPAELVPHLEHALADVLALDEVVLDQSSRLMPRQCDDAGRPVLSEFERAQRIPT